MDGSWVGQMVYWVGWSIGGLVDVKHHHRYGTRPTLGEGAANRSGLSGFSKRLYGTWEKNVFRNM